MSFPVYSTSVETAAIARVCRVMGRSHAGINIAKGEVFDCRKIAGSDQFSQHAWGNAADLFVRAGGDKALYHLADAVVAQVVHRTKANLGRRLAVSQVIDHDNRRIWEPGVGWHPYTGTTGAHVHVSGAPLREGTPPCA